MPDIFDLVPKDKFDSSTIAALKSLADEEIVPILPALLEWIQDCNWPVASDILPVLALHQAALVPLIHSVLGPNEKDDIWKYWIIICLIPLFSDVTIDQLLPDIQRIAQNPTQNELREEVQEAAVSFLQDRRAKQTMSETEVIIAQIKSSSLSITEETYWAQLQEGYQLLVRLHDLGVEKQWAYQALLTYHNRLEDSLSRDYIADILDYIVGWCSPQYRIWDE